MACFYAAPLAWNPTGVDSGQVADLLPHAPSGLIRHTKLALQFLAADTVARRAEQIHRIEPRNERGACVVKDGVSSRRNLEPAFRAGIDAAFAQLVERDANRTARRTIHCRATEANSHDVNEASLFIGEAGKELADRKFRRCGRAAFRHTPLWRCD